jgi:aspartate/methionine/tyrosine aminotransferase
MPDQRVINEATQEIQKSGVHGYASYRGSPALRASMAAWYQRFYQVKVKPQTEVLPLLGSKEGIGYLTLSLVNSGDTVLIPNPGYLAYASAAKIAGAIPVTYHLYAKHKWMPDFESLEKQIVEIEKVSKVKLLWCNYPHMPTGARADESIFGKFVSLAKRYNFLIANDNPYGLVLNQRPPLSILAAQATLTHVCELNSLSKSLNMAGWRVGMLLGHEELINQVINVKGQFDSGMFLPVQKAASIALELDEAWHDRRNIVYKERRQVLEHIFKRLEIQFDPEQEGLFLWGKLPSTSLNSEAYCEKLLNVTNIFFTPGSIFGSQGEGYIRASLCAPKERLEMALSRVEVSLETFKI